MKYLQKIILPSLFILLIIPQFLCELIAQYNIGTKNIYFNVTKPLTLACEVTEPNEKASDIKWEKENGKLPENHVVKLELKKSILYIDHTNKTDDGIYLCKHESKQQDFVVIANLELKIKPSNDEAVVEDETLVLKCYGVGTGLEVKWILPTNMSDEAITFTPDNGLENSILTLTGAKPEHRGKYTCEGRHKESLNLDAVVTTDCYVRVKDKYAALWPFILICIEVFILCAIILIYERHRTSVEVEDSETEQDQSKNGKN
uniref:CSON010683 protein n=1 Tax=Culicoides sonorensis TaxID=179676 RepID=A0A336LL46_CULSO